VEERHQIRGFAKLRVGQKRGKLLESFLSRLQSRKALYIYLGAALSGVQGQQMLTLESMSGAFFLTLLETGPSAAFCIPKAVTF
jgi:hypothetical protein